ncbi:outer membrane insertion C- signal [Marinoscillum sp. MHG1-6]|uniref:outer membrane insertion C- signal n=1 Tax=Marinoscillum sp. MHG1-6 TaxID=2959627 RepID=UPI00215711BB|nr:outer membrane insertion C- signal [Marinoscillum sp. MHG1-6]
MKKLLILSVFVLGLTQLSQAQELGIRFGDVTGGDVALDAVFSAGQFSMIHADVSFGNNGVGIDALYDFIYRPLGDAPLNWYLGVGPSLYLGNVVLLGVAGEIGLAFKIPNAPVSLSADWRPTFYLIENTDFHAGFFGLNIRYVFGN